MLQPRALVKYFTTSMDVIGTMRANHSNGITGYSQKRIGLRESGGILTQSL